MNRAGLFPIFAFPIILAIGILLIPVNPDYNDHALAVQTVEQTNRWFAGHLISAIAFAFSIWAAREILDVLPKAPWYTLIFIATGAGLYAAGLGADGIAPVAVMASGESALIFFDGSGWWVSGVFMAGTLFFGIGLFIMISNSIPSKLRARLFSSNFLYFYTMNALADDFGATRSSTGSVPAPMIWTSNGR